MDQSVELGENAFESHVKCPFPVNFKQKKTLKKRRDRVFEGPLELTSSSLFRKSYPVEETFVKLSAHDERG